MDDSTRDTWCKEEPIKYVIYCKSSTYRGDKEGYYIGYCSLRRELNTTEVRKLLSLKSSQLSIAFLDKDSAKAYFSSQQRLSGPYEYYAVEEPVKPVNFHLDPLPPATTPGQPTIAQLGKDLKRKDIFDVVTSVAKKFAVPVADPIPGRIVNIERPVLPKTKPVAPVEITINNAHNATPQ